MWYSTDIFNPSYTAKENFIKKNETANNWLIFLIHHVWYNIYNSFFFNFFLSDS